MKSRLALSIVLGTTLALSFATQARAGEIVPPAAVTSIPQGSQINSSAIENRQVTTRINTIELGRLSIGLALPSDAKATKNALFTIPTNGSGTKNIVIDLAKSKIGWTKVSAKCLPTARQQNQSQVAIGSTKISNWKARCLYFSDYSSSFLSSNK